MKGRFALISPVKAMPENKALFALCALLAVAEWLVGFDLDFQVYFGAAADYSDGGWQKVYSPQAITPFKYHPITVWLFAPMRFFPWSVATALWALLNAFFTFDACRRFQKYFEAANWVPVLALLCVGHAWSWQVKFGNVTCLMLWLFALFATSSVLWKKAGSAALILLKPFWVVLLPVFVLEKSWKALGLTLALVAAGCAAIFLSGLDNGLLAYDLWQKTLADPTNAHNYPKNDNQCIYATLCRGGAFWGADKTWVWVLVSGEYFALALLTVSRNHALRALALLPPMLFAGPLSWIHHQILLIPVFIFLLSRRHFWLAAIAAFLFTGTGEAFVGRQLFVMIHQAGLPVLGFLALSLGFTANRKWF